MRRQFICEPDRLVTTIRTHLALTKQIRMFFANRLRRLQPLKGSAFLCCSVINADFEFGMRSDWFFEVDNKLGTKLFTPIAQTELGGGKHHQKKVNAAWAGGGGSQPLKVHQLG